MFWKEWSFDVLLKLSSSNYFKTGPWLLAYDNNIIISYVSFKICFNKLHQLQLFNADGISLHNMKIVDQNGAKVRMLIGLLADVSMQHSMHFLAVVHLCIIYRFFSHFNTVNAMQ